MKSSNIPRTKPKRKNSEKRKEKSRNAARERRSQESCIFDEIERLLPVPSKTLEHLDKASLIRIAINYVKTRSMVDFLKVPNVSDLFDCEHFSSLNTLDGFMLVISKDGSLAYVSENIDHFLGLNHIDLLGHSVFDYTHPCDHSDLKTFLEPLQGETKTLSSIRAGPCYARMKCTLTTKGRSLNLKSAKYLTVKLTGQTLNLKNGSVSRAKNFDATFDDYIIALCELLPTQTSTEIPLAEDVFVTKHSPDMKFTFVDDSVTELFGFESNELIGTSFYELFDPADFSLMNSFFKTLFAKGQSDSGHYRLPVKSGGHRWISTQSVLLHKPNCGTPESVILIHRVLSNIENVEQVTSHLQQLPSSQPILPLTSSTAQIVNRGAGESFTASILGGLDCAPLPAVLDPLIQLNRSPIGSSTAAIVAESSLNPPPPSSFEPAQAQVKSSTSEFVCEDFAGQRSTQSVVVPKTADMESSFLMFTDTASADEEDLTHLAPSSDDFAADIAMPSLSDMNLADLNLLEDLFLAGSSSGSGSNFNVPDDDDLLSTFDDAFNEASDADDKLKFDAFDAYESFDKCKSSALERQFALANDPFMSFDPPESLLLTSSSPSSCSLSDLYSSSSNSPITSPPNVNFCISQFSTLSTPMRDLVSQTTLCDSEHDRDADMRAPFIPIDDDFLLNDLTYTDTNIDDFYSWISSSGGVAYLPHGDTTTKGSSMLNESLCGKSNKGVGSCLETLLQKEDLVSCLKNKHYNSNELSSGLISAQNLFATTQQSKLTMGGRNNQQQQKHSNFHKSNSQSQLHKCSLASQLAKVSPNDTKTENTTNIVNSANSKQVPLNAISMSATTKRKNNVLTTNCGNGGTSNIVILAKPNDSSKKLKSGTIQVFGDSLHTNNTSTAANGSKGAGSVGNSNTTSCGNGAMAASTDKQTIHHFVLTKNKQLIPKSDFADQTIKISSKRILTTDSANSANNSSNSCESNKDETPNKKIRNSNSCNTTVNCVPVLERTYSPNSVLMNLLVNGLDLANGYELSALNSPSNNANNSSAANILSQMNAHQRHQTLTTIPIVVNGNHRSESSNFFGTN